MPATGPARSALRLALLEPNVVFWLSYEDWEAAFIERWGCTVREFGAGAQLYIMERKLDKTWMTFREALRAFWMNELSFTGPEPMFLYLREVNPLVEEIVHPELDEIDHERLQQEIDDRRDIERGYHTRYFDMNPQSSDRDQGWSGQQRRKADDHPDRSDAA